MVSVGCVRIQTVLRLAGAEGDDAADWIVRRHADGHAISRNNFDTKAAHAAAELGEHLVAGIALDPVEPTAVNGDHGSLHVYEIILAQMLANPFLKQRF